MLEEVIPDDLVDHFRTNHEADFAYSIPGVGRFRVNAYQARGTVRPGVPPRRRRCAVARRPRAPEVVGQLALEPRGLVLVTGPTGSGKTTTLASMVDLINTLQRGQHRHDRGPDRDPSLGQEGDRLAARDPPDTADFTVALRAAMRQDPDVILVGEMRDVETVRAALSAAETGHLVLATLHTIDAAETINRIVDFFPPHEQAQVRITLAQTLRGIVSQRLVRLADGAGRRSAIEVMVNTGRTREAILDPSDAPPLIDLIPEGDFYKMQTFDQHLFQLVRDEVITFEEALAASTGPHDLTVELRQAGLVS